MTIESWMPTLRTNLATISGIQQVHDYSNLPAALMVFPCIVIMPVRGYQESLAGGGVALHELQVTLYLSNQILPEAMGAAVPFIGLVRNNIYAHATLGGLAAHCLPVPDAPFYEGPGAITYGDKSLLGVAFHLQVKEIESLTISA
jgi:hypothetical protein